MSRTAARPNAVYVARGPLGAVGLKGVLSGRDAVEAGGDSAPPWLAVMQRRYLGAAAPLRCEGLEMAMGEPPGPVLEPSERLAHVRGAASVVLIGGDLGLALELLKRGSAVSIEQRDDAARAWLDREAQALGLDAHLQAIDAAPSARTAEAAIVTLDTSPSRFARLHRALMRVRDRGRIVLVTPGHLHERIAGELARLPLPITWLRPVGERTLLPYRGVIEARGGIGVFERPAELPSLHVLAPLASHKAWQGFSLIGEREVATNDGEVLRELLRRSLGEPSLFHLRKRDDALVVSWAMPTGEMLHLRHVAGEPIELWVRGLDVWLVTMLVCEWTDVRDARLVPKAAARPHEELRLG